MVERQDLDALLIGALYGELTPADEARLAAHLESHPADRGVLDDLKNARQSVRESRIFELQVDPPQAVSAQLLQEAARRAPRRRFGEQPGESWFWRFVRSFVAHPAMAAAAMLVVVVGVAGTLYLKKGGDEFAEPTAVTEAVKVEPSPAKATGQAQGAPDQAPPAATAPGPDYRVGLADNGVADKERADRDESSAKTPSRGRPSGASAAVDSKPADLGFATKHGATKGKKLGPYMEVRTPEPTPKNLPAKDDDGKDDALDQTIALGGAAHGAGAATGSIEKPPAYATQAAPAVQPSAPARQKVAAPVTQEPPAVLPPAHDTALIAWAKSQHAQAVSLTRAGKCSDAASVAIAVSNQAPDYYNQFMAADSELKPCQQSITIARKSADRSDANKAAKAKPQINVKEAPTTSK